MVDLHTVMVELPLRFFKYRRNAPFPLKKQRTVFYVFDI